MTHIRQKHKKNLAAVAAAACIVLGASATAYAADVGGIQEIFSGWIHGEKVSISVRNNADDIGYTFSAHTDEDEISWGGGGVAIDDDGTETKLSAQELMDDYESHPQVDTDAEGHVWIYLKAQAADITDLFDGNGICRVSLTDGVITYYVKITRDADGSYPYESTPGIPEDGAELYTPIP